VNTLALAYLSVTAWQGTTVELSGSGQLGVGGRGTVCEVIVEFSAAARIPKQSGIAQAELANEAAALTAIGPHPNIIEAHGWAYAPQWQTDVLLLELAHDSLFNQIWCAAVFKSVF
jgi:hypothetical protein